MTIEKNVLTTVDLGRENMILLENDVDKFQSNVQYPIKSDVAFTTPFAGQIEFKAGETKIISGLLAEKVLVYAKQKGFSVNVLTKKSEKEKAIIDTVSELQAKVAKLENISEEEVIAPEEDVPDIEISTKKKVVKKKK